ncbi:hypothetical protein CR513_39091, partial [Mucuna pruriens]
MRSWRWPYCYNKYTYKTPSDNVFIKELPRTRFHDLIGQWNRGFSTTASAKILGFGFFNVVARTLECC